MKQEPVAVYGYCPECGAKGVTRERRPDGNDKCVNGHTYQSRKATHPPQRTEQEPMVWYCCFQGQEEGEFFLFGSPNSERYPSQYKTPLYEHLPQRTWVGLAAEDRLTAKYMQDAPDGIQAVIDYIESKLKELNT